MEDRKISEFELEVFGGEICVDGDRVIDYDVDGCVVEGCLKYTINGWLANWDDGECTQVLNPLQLHKLSDHE